MRTTLIIFILSFCIQTQAQVFTTKEKDSLVQQLRKEIMQSLLHVPRNDLDSAFQNQKNASVKKEPFEGIDMTWANGNDRREENIWKNSPYFTPSILLDLNYNYSFNNPVDNTVVGSTALARHNEVQLSALHFGGDFTYKNARARIMTQFGTRSTVVPRNDLSTYRGQYQLDNVYRYLSEAYVEIPRKVTTFFRGKLTTKS